ncbi:MAG: M23 family metallopeptidase [Paludibacteraceae bacterium]|nr:M23 family metallopeptidase [Paludibacteraceae bacterium]HOI27440.1 M23 family metallopeptidase [Paludibacteraceae bacterium]HOU68979.1 M23 family metallopeptidase [Paludibacteraceae bacterium]HPH63701.1 M23 family metallopeptidase [Paludibacteraceae bacterium]HQF50778.1 M23 family metallopeptidase [Paludibacteraceae bacterium]
MAKPKFHYNPITLTYERIDNTIKHKLKKIGSHAITSILSGLACFVAFVLLINSPRERILKSEKAQLEAQYEILNNQLDQVQETLTDIEQRDNNLYRVVVQADPIPSDIRNGNNQSSRYEDLRKKTNSELAVITTKRIDQIRRQVYVQSNSFDEIVNMAKNKEEMLLCMPAIQPVLNKDLNRMASGYGIRIDPIYKTPKFHAGMDFSGDRGTEIYATGKGVIEFKGWKQGYGNAVIINHGFGYKTLYAHLDKFKLRQGARVNRGDVIAYMGNTGKSTGNHLHYEVHYKGKVTDPRNYYYLDLNPEEYDKMVQLSSNYGNVFD